MNLSKVFACLLAASFAGALHADTARFDLVGPKIDIRVTRGSVTLPIAEVPNLQPGDKIWLKADLPRTQSNHLLLVVAFLRGTTNEPPDGWFTEIDTWDKKTVEGTTVTVPEEAEQALLFVAPETGGDFKTLRSAVKGKPGLFIRSDSDLNEASFEQQRIERYLAEMKTVPQDNPKAIQDRSAKLAATLALKPKADCFKQPVDQQVSCLTQSSAPVLLDDGHGQSIAEALSTGASSDFINAASTTQLAGAGVYSAYVGTIVDLVHLTTSLRTAQYQYIPAISFPQGQTLNLKLNAPPSFHNPKSVIVVGLPAIQKAKLPPLHTHNPDQVSCLLQPKMTLLLEGAPLVFATSFAHDLTLHLNRTGAPTDIPLTPDAFEGGLVVSKEPAREPLQAVAPAEPDAANSTPADTGTKAKHDAKSDARIGTSTDLTITGTVRGYWGFDPFVGPTLTLQQVDGKGWKIVGNTQLLAGQDNQLTLRGDGTACVRHIELANDKGDKGRGVDVTFKPAPPEGDKDVKDTLALNVSLKKVQPGGYSLTIQQYGDKDEDRVPLTAYAGDIHLAELKIHTGDDTAVLSGEALGDVVSVAIGDGTFTPAGDPGDGNTVHLESKTAVSPKNGTEAQVKLKDGRTLPVKISVEPPRPGLKLLSFHDKAAQPQGTLPVALDGKGEIPLDGQLTFVVQTKEVFPRTQTIEVATADGSVHTSLSLAANTLVLQDEHTAVATLDPLKAFGQSAFGKLQMRPVAGDGTAGDWTPLGTLVRTPSITGVSCTTEAAPTCSVAGSQLFLVQSFSADKEFTKPVEVPTGFAESTFAAPTPSNGTTLYMKLRDDPETVASVTLPTPIPQPTPGAAPAPASPGSSAGAAPASATVGSAEGPTSGVMPAVPAKTQSPSPAPSGSASVHGSQPSTPQPDLAAQPSALPQAVPAAHPSASPDAAPAAQPAPPPPAPPAAGPAPAPAPAPASATPGAEQQPSPKASTTPPAPASQPAQPQGV